MQMTSRQLMWIALYIDEINSVAPGVWEHGRKLTQSVNDRKACIMSPIFS